MGDTDLSLLTFSFMIQLQKSVSKVQFLESSTVGRSIVSKQEARVCDLENKLEFQRGQVKRFEVRSFIFQAFIRGLSTAGFKGPLVDIRSFFIIMGAGHCSCPNVFPLLFKKISEPSLFTSYKNPETCVNRTNPSSGRSCDVSL